ncbi:MAG: hypothetical protein K0B02_00510 [DPANN group archaeon]|nr:hypothetical protein [DPANN group archaeon]
MNINVICKKCDHMFRWDIDKTEEKCPYCYSILTMKDIRMTPLEYKKYLQYIKTHRTAYKETNNEQLENSMHITETATNSINETETTEPLKGKFIIKKGRTKYGTIEMTDPDYMILKLSIWAMGPQQKYIIKQLNKKIHDFLKDAGFDID